MKHIFSEKITDAMREVLGPGPVGLHEPSFSGNELAYLKECIDTTFVSSVGKFVDRFEHDLSELTGAKYAIAVVNGTAALHVALILADIREHDEVLIPSLTFVATANAVSYCNAIPHFVEVEESTLGISAGKLRNYLHSISYQQSGKCINRLTGRVIKALVPMHTFGHPADIDGLLAVAKDFNLVLIEDAAESLGSYYNSKHTGTFGLIGTLSFNGNKTITTGGGGALLTNNTELARRAKHLTTTAKLPHPWEYRHDTVGYNYRLPNLNAALGCAQLEQLQEKLASKRRLYYCYKEAFSGIEGVRLMAEPNGCCSNYWLQTLILDNNLILERDNILKITNDSGFMTRPVWTLMHRLQQFQGFPQMPLDVSENLSQRLVNIPSGPNLIIEAS